MNLKPCPFCGGEAVMHERFDSISKYVHKKAEIPNNVKFLCSTKYASGVLYYKYREKVFIPQCCDTSCIGRSTKPFKNEKEAAEAWNRRAEE